MWIRVYHFINCSKRRIKLARTAYAYPKIGLWFRREPISEDDLYEHYYPWAEKRVANALMELGHYAEAKQVLEDALELPGFEGELAEELVSVIKICDVKILNATDLSRSSTEAALEGSTQPATGGGE